MNSRIRELVGQAKFMAEETINKQISKNAELDAFAEKFAELIVRECCDVLQNEDIRHGGYGYNQGFLHKKIKEHFGVEE
jgi:hypothetical protein